MKKAQEYRQHAAECRVLARGASTPEEREQLLGMAENWERLADQRVALQLQEARIDIGEVDLGFTAEEFRGMSDRERITLCRRLSQRARELGALVPKDERAPYDLIADQWEKLAEQAL